MKQNTDYEFVLFVKDGSFFLCTLKTLCSPQQSAFCTRRPPARPRILFLNSKGSRPKRPLSILWGPAGELWSVYFKTIRVLTLIFCSMLFYYLSLGFHLSVCKEAWRGHSRQKCHISLHPGEHCNSAIGAKRRAAKGQKMGHSALSPFNAF